MLTALEKRNTIAHVVMSHSSFFVQISHNAEDNGRQNDESYHHNNNNNVDVVLCRVKGEGCG